MKLEKYRVKPGGFRLRDHDPGDTGGFHSKEAAKRHVRASVKTMRMLQEKLYADDRYALLLIFQAMDAAGKDGAIKHVMSGVNPQGCQVYSFKQPSAEELDHDFLWRTNKCLPERGRIGIFNRSYYEEVLVVRVHPEILDEAAAAAAASSARTIWKERFEDISAHGALPDAQRHGDPQVLPARLEGRAAPPLPRAPRRAGEELEVLCRRRQGARATGSDYMAGVRGDDRSHQQRRTRPGT